MRMIYLLWTLVLYQGILHGGECFRPPDFRSEWLPIQAQGGPASMVETEHNLGVVPDLVEVLVKVVDGDNKDFIFKAMGTANKDDDFNDPFGRVVFLYNDTVVRVMAPTHDEDFYSGGAIYTGESPAWRGVNSQFSQMASVQVKCWTSSSLPSPCFHSTGTIIQSGSTAGSSAYHEITHGLGQYPDLLKVRAKMTNGNMPGWYCDAQGAVTGQLSNSVNYYWQTSSGFYFGYNLHTTRIWASSYNVDKLCETLDGWAVEMHATEGEVEVTAWCDFGLAVTNEISMDINASTSVRDLEIQLPNQILELDNALVSFVVRANSGPNVDFLFEGISSASSDVYNIGTNPCDYGGIIYAFSPTAVRMWVPNPSVSGSAICISDGYGNGMNAQGTDDVTVIIKVRQWQVLNSAVDYEPLVAPYSCGHWYLVSANASYQDLLLDQQVITSIGACWHLCHTNGACSTFTFKQFTCTLFIDFDETLLVSEVGSEVWTTEN